MTPSNRRHKRKIKLKDFFHDHILSHLKHNMSATVYNDPMPIFEASSNGYTETLSKLVKNGANINIANDEGMTPLHIAIKNGHTETVKVLIAAGANISTKSAINGWTPLYIACAKGYTDIVNALIEAGADVNVPMATGITPLSIAIMKSHIDVVVALMKAGAGKKCAIY